MTQAASQNARMLAGDLYSADDPELRAARLRAQQILAQFNATPADAEPERRRRLAALVVTRELH